MESIGRFVDELYSMPSELTTPKRVFLLSQSLRPKILTASRLRILKFLKEQNPVSVAEIRALFKDKQIDMDLRALEHYGLIRFNGAYSEDCIVEFDRDIVVLPVQ